MVRTLTATAKSASLRRGFRAGLAIAALTLMQALAGDWGTHDIS